MVRPLVDNLGKRQSDLNARVSEAISQNVNFENIEGTEETTALDKFFKIDLAAKYKNVEYIISIFKSGETLYAYRALKKCPWLYTNEYAYIFNPEYLHENVFPFTSVQIKRLILKTIAMKVRQEDRAEAMYHYCVQTKMTDIALKSLLFTSEEFRLHIIRNHSNSIGKHMTHKNNNYVRFIIGKSFELLEAYMKMISEKYSNTTIRRFKYLYPVHKLKYLELLEKYDDVGKGFFDSKFSTEIMKNNKERVLEKAEYYTSTIQSDILKKYSNVEDVKVYAIALLPSQVNHFWGNFYYEQNKSILSMIPHDETYRFIKTIFHNKYPGEEFEMHISFHYQNYQRFMTVDEREKWALKQLESDEQVLGVGNDYKWYEFINFKDAFEGIKKCVLVTKDADIRNDMTKILIKSAKTNKDLTILSKYYFRRHVNELREYKSQFLREVILHHNVFQFDETCWDAFYTLLLTMELYNSIDFKEEYEDFKTVTLFYHIVHGKQMPEELMKYLLEEFFPRCEHDYYHNRESIHVYLNKLEDEKRQFLYNYLLDFFMNKIVEMKNLPQNPKRSADAKRYFEIVVTLMRIFNVSYERVQRPHHQKKRKTRKVNTCLSDRQLLRELKSDKNLAIDRLLTLKQLLSQNEPIKIRLFLRKIKIYYEQDITQSFLNMFEELITKDWLTMESVDACVQGIFELSDIKSKVKLMDSYKPEEEKIDYHNFDSLKLRIQKSICRFAPQSKPPVPFPNMLNYIRGDYTQYCLHVFSIYIVSLTMPECVKFVKFMLNTPVSVQKHALRLAYQCLDIVTVKNISKEIWEKTKNVSLRSIIYKALFHRIEANLERQLYDILIAFTLDLKDDDDDSVFDVIASNTLPNDIQVRYTEACWRSVGAFRDREPNIQRKTDIIKGIQEKITLFLKEGLVKTIIDEHLKDVFFELTYCTKDIVILYEAKWSLISEYIFCLSRARLTDDALELTERIIRSCIERWDVSHFDKYTYQQRCWHFISDLSGECVLYNSCYEAILPVFERILQILTANLQINAMYLLKMGLEIAIASGNVVKSVRDNLSSETVDTLSLKFGAEVGNLIHDHVEKEQYFPSFAERIKFLIAKVVNDLLVVLFAGDVQTSLKHSNRALVSVATGLAQFENTQNYLLALLLLPNNSECPNEEYQMFLDKVQKFPCTEVQYALHCKFKQIDLKPKTEQIEPKRVRNEKKRPQFNMRNNKSRRRRY